jgi:signal transduction histidine kinase
LGRTIEIEKNQIIKQHDGEIAIESDVGQGTELTVTLPIQQST